MKLYEKIIIILGFISMVLLLWHVFIVGKWYHISISLSSFIFHQKYNFLFFSKISLDILIFLVYTVLINQIQSHMKNLINHLRLAKTMKLAIEVVRVNGEGTKFSSGLIENIDNSNKNFTLIKVSGNFFIINHNDIISSASASNSSKMAYGVMTINKNSTTTFII